VIIGGNGPTDGEVDPVAESVGLLLVVVDAGGEVDAGGVVAGGVVVVAGGDVVVAGAEGDGLVGGASLVGVGVGDGFLVGVGLCDFDEDGEAVRDAVSRLVLG
jgi:hypothetical protein